MKKLNNKVLLLVLVVLAGIFVLSRVFRSPSLESNLDKNLIAADTAAIDEVRITLSDSTQPEVKLLRKEGKWYVQSGSREAVADRGSVNSMLGMLKDLKAERVVSRKQENWETYQVGEGSGTLVKAYADGAEQAGLRIGKVGFNTSQNRNPYGGGGGSPYTYVRLTDDKDVFAVDGFIVSHFNRKYDDWRNKTFTRLKKEEIVQISFTYPDSAFTVARQDSVWKAGDLIVENTAVESYLNKLQVRNLYEFADDFKPAGPAPLVVQFHGSNGPLLTIQAWKEGEEWIVSSSLQAGVYFSGTSAFKDLFAPRSAFLK